MLKDEFLDIPFIIDESFKTLIASSPKFDPDFAGARSYINECRALVYELKQYQVDLLDVNTSGCKLLSHIIFSKLSTSFKRELVRKVNNNYPTVGDLFEQYSDIIKTVVRTSNPKNHARFEKKESSVKGKTAQQGSSKPQNKSKQLEKSSPSTLENFRTSVEAKNDSVGNNASNKSPSHHDANNNVKKCKFCSGNGHSKLYCTKYEKVSDRQQKRIALGICALCTSSKHDASKCPGKDSKLSFSCIKCKQNSHISALCPGSSSGGTSSHLCINVQHFKNSFQPFLLPVLSIKFHG